MNSARSSVAVSCVVCLAAVAHAAPPEYAASVTGSQPILWYRLGEAAGNFTNSGSLGAAFDAVATGNPARAVATPGGDAGVGLARGAFLESLGASTLTGNPTFSIEVVVNLANPGAASLWGPFLHWGDGGANRNGKEVYFGIQNANNTRIYAGFYNGGVRMPYDLDGNTWTHIVWTRQGGTDSEAGSKLYINGCLIAIERDSALGPGFFPASTINVTSSSFRINEARDFATLRYFTGVLDEIALFDRILTADEIAFRGSLFKCPADRNCDAVVDLNDFFDFFNCFDATDPCADVNADSFVDLVDFFEFLNGFAAGC